MIHHVDHPFPPWVELEITQCLERYPLEYGHQALDQGPRFFGRTLRDQGQVIVTMPWPLAMIESWVISAWAPSLGLGRCSLWRTQLNGQLGGQAAGEHYDYSDPHKVTVLYYCLGRSGDTVFRDDQGQERDRCVFQQHRAVAYPSRLWHEALAPDLGDWRVSMAMVIDTNL